MTIQNYNMESFIVFVILIVLSTGAKLPIYNRLTKNAFAGKWHGGFMQPSFQWPNYGGGGMTDGGGGAGGMPGAGDYVGGWTPGGDYGDGGWMPGGGDYGGGMPGGDGGDGGWMPGGGDYGGGMPGGDGGDGGWMPGGGDYGGGMPGGDGGDSGWMPGGDYGGMPGGGGDYDGGMPGMPGGGDYDGGMPGGGDGGGWFPPMDTTTAPVTTTTLPPTCESQKGDCVPSDIECGTGIVGAEICETGVCCLPPVLPDDICGKTAFTKIVGGNEAAAHTWPWQVSLQSATNDFHFCGGSLVNEQWVVTAAHCVTDIDNIKIMLGEHDRNVTHGPEVERSAIKIISHEHYQNGAPYPNDIALLKLNESVTFTAEIWPACVPMSGDLFTKENECYISGWGDTKDTGDMSKLNEMLIEVIDNPTCENNWGSGYILKTNICVGNGDIGACNGDSGGPLSCKKDNRWMLAGATSWGISGCQTAGYPNVYTRVSEYREWITQKIRLG